MTLPLRVAWQEVRPLPEPVPDPVTLDLFVSTVRLGSLNKAADLHGISQPSATARIRKLEHQLGMTLLDRSSTGSTPTVHGSLVAEWATGVRDALARLIEGSRALRTGGPDPLRLVASYTTAEYLVPGWLDRLRRLRADARVELEVANSSHVIEALVDGRAHLAFVETPMDLGGLTSAVVGHDELVLVTSPAGVLSDGASDGASAGGSGGGSGGGSVCDGVTLGPDDIASLPLVLREPGSGTRETFDRAMAAAGAPPIEPVLQLGSTSAIKGALSAGVGVAALSELAVSEELRMGSLVSLQVRGLHLGRELRAAWLGERPSHELAAMLLDIALAGGTGGPTGATVVSDAQRGIYAAVLTEQGI